MKKLLTFAAVLLFSVTGRATTCPTGYTNIYTWTIPPQTTLAASVSNPVITFPGNSALTSSVLQSPTGVDLVPCTAASSGTILPYFRVPNSYNSSTGAIEMKIVVPTIYNATTSVVVYFMAGEASPTDYSSGSGVCSAAGLISAHSFGTSSTLDLTDWCGNTAVNHGATAVAGEINGGAAFGGTPNYIDAGFAPSATAIGIEAWVNPTNATNVQFIGSTGNTNGGWGFYIYSAGATFQTFSSSGGESDYRAVSGGVTASSYQLLAGSFAGGSASTASNYAVYRNGTAMSASMVSSAASTLGSSSFNLSLGRQQGGTPTYYLTGDIDEELVYNFAPSPSQFKLDYISQSNPAGLGTFTTLTCATPTFSPVAGSYSSTQTVTISDATAGNTISCCTGSSGCSPTPGTCTNPTTISSSIELCAYATATGYTQSATYCGTYIIGSSTPLNGISLFVP